MSDHVSEFAEQLGTADATDRIQIKLIYDALGRDATMALVRRAARGRTPMALFISLARQAVPRGAWFKTFIPRRQSRGSFSRVFMPKGMHLPKKLRG
jgi:hypothetical protein